MPATLYWDASALLSLLVEDRHSATARRRFATPGPHLVSSLAFTEVCAVVARLERGHHLSAGDWRQAIGSLSARPWSALHLEPDRHRIADLAARHRLRGADLWHLAAAATLAAELPGLSLVTFDTDLAEAAHAEGLAPAAGKT